jgi:hypothetical protein
LCLFSFLRPPTNGTRTTRRRDRPSVRRHTKHIAGKAEPLPNERRPRRRERDAATVELDFGETGRIPAVAQDADTGAVLMLAYVTLEAVEQTRETGLAHYYSRNREELWQKGGTSGRAGIRG